MAYAFVQFKSAVDFSGGSVSSLSSGALGSSVTAGNLLHIDATAGANVSLTASRSTDTFTGIDTVFSAALNQNLGTIYCKNASSGTTAVTLTPGSSAPFLGIAVREYSGFDPTSPLQTAHTINEQSTPGTGTDAITSTNVTPTAQPAGVIGTGFDVAGSGATLLHGTGYGNTQSGWPQGVNSCTFEDKRITATSAVAATFTAPNSGAETLTAVVVYSEAGGGGGVTGSAAITEGADTVAGTGSVGVSGSAAIVEGADTVAGTGSVGVSGSAAITEGADTVTASGTATTGVVGSAAITEGADTVSASGSVGVSGSAAVAEGADIVAATGSTPSNIVPAGRHRKWYGVRDGQQLLVFDSKVKADAARIAVAERDAPKPKNRARRVKVREMPPPHEVLQLPQVKRLAESQHETNTYHELLAAHSYTPLIQLYHDLRAQQQLRAQQAEEEEIAMILLHL